MPISENEEVRLKLSGEVEAFLPMQVELDCRSLAGEQLKLLHADDDDDEKH